MSEQFKHLAWYNKIAVVAATFAAVGSIAAALGLSIPRLVWADEFYGFQQEVYDKELARLKKDLRSIKLHEFQITQENKQVPEFLLQEKLEIEDEIDEIRLKLEKLEDLEDEIRR